MLREKPRVESMSRGDLLREESTRFCCSEGKRVLEAVHTYLVLGVRTDVLYTFAERRLRNLSAAPRPTELTRECMHAHNVQRPAANSVSITDTPSVLPTVQ